MKKRNRGRINFLKMIITGVALISMCVSLIQEQAARSAALAMGLKKEVIEMDVVVVVRRRSR